MKKMIINSRNNIVSENRTQSEIQKGWGECLSPLVSVCCITYNHASYIKDAIDSFLMQETNFAFEILIHDDASTDETTQIILDYAEQYPDIIKPVIQDENQYLKCSLINPRFLFPKAVGKYIALCDGDDYWTDRSKLDKQVGFLENNPDYVITYTDCVPVDKNGVINADFKGARRDLESVELQKSPPIYTLTTCFRNVLDEVPLDLMSARYGDLVLWSRLGHYGKGKYMENIQPAIYRVHGQGVHSRTSKKQKFSMGFITYAALFAYYKRISNDQLSNYFLREAFKFSLRSMGVTGMFGVIFHLMRRYFEKVKSFIKNKL